MKITTEKKQVIKIYDWLKTKKLTLKDFISKKQFKSYNDLVDYCNKISMLPCSEHDFDKIYLEINPPKVLNEILKEEEIQSSLSEEEIKQVQEEPTIPKQKKNKTG
jgi:hypothetical protein